MVSNSYQHYKITLLYHLIMIYYDDKQDQCYHVAES